MKKNITQNLNCPVRGELKEKGTLSEEYRRIECIRFLLEKGYPKENFDFEREIIKYSHSGRNSLRADLVVYNVAKSNINPNDISDDVLYALGLLAISASPNGFPSIFIK